MKVGDVIKKLNFHFVPIMGWLFVVYMAVAAYGHFHYLLPWHEEEPAISIEVESTEHLSYKSEGEVIKDRQNRYCTANPTECVSITWSAMGMGGTSVVPKPESDYWN